MEYDGAMGNDCWAPGYHVTETGHLGGDRTKEQGPKSPLARHRVTLERERGQQVCSV